MGDIALDIVAPSHRDLMFEGIWRLLGSGVGSDFEIFCTDSNPIKAHFFVLQIFCHVLQNSSCRCIRFESSEVQIEDLRCLLEFIYRGKTQIQVERLDVVKRVALKLGLRIFLDLAEQIKIATVEEKMEDGFLGKEKDESTSIIRSTDSNVTVETKEEEQQSET